jgi:hypothetical protein
MVPTASIFRDKILINCNLDNFDLSINSSILFKDDFSDFTINTITQNNSSYSCEVTISLIIVKSLAGKLLAGAGDTDATTRYIIYDKQNLHALRYRAADNLLALLVDDTCPRHTTCIAQLDADTCAVGNKFGGSLVT